jgi:transporter family protein
VSLIPVGDNPEITKRSMSIVHEGNGSGLALAFAHAPRAFSRLGALVQEEAMPMNWFVSALLAAIAAAATAVLAKVGVKDVNSNLATAIRTLVVVGFAWGIVFLSGAQSGVSQLSRHTLAFLALSGIATGLSSLFYFRALQLGEASRVAPIDKFSLVLTIVFASVFLGEAMNWGVVAGVALITAGTLLVALS